MSEADAAAAATTDEAPAQKAGATKSIVLVGALTGGLLLGAAAGVFALGPMMARKAGYAAAPAAGAADTAGGGEHSSGKEGSAAPTSVHLIDNVILNPAGSGGTRFLMMQAAVDLAEASLVEEFKARDAEVRDVVLRVMGRKSVEELADLANREHFRQELKDSLGALVKKGSIRGLYFPQFVIQ